MTNPQRRPLATRQEAYRLLRPHLLALGAMALAADRGASQVTAAMLRNSDRGRYEPKMRGLIVAVAWGEGVREWVNAVRPPNVRLHTPHDWTELLIGQLHVRIQRDTKRQLSPRRQQRNQQFPDPMLPFAVTLDGARIPEDITNVNVDAILNSEGRVQSVRAVAPYGKGFAWTAIDIDMRQARQQLASWERRQVPWLATIRQFGELAVLDDVAIERDMLLERVDGLHGQIAELQRQLRDLRRGVDDTVTELGVGAPPQADEAAPSARRYRTPPKEEPREDPSGSEGPSGDEGH